MRSVLPAAALLLVSRAAAAQVTVTVSAAGATSLSSGASIPLTSANTRLQVTCQGIDCTQLTARAATADGGMGPVPKEPGATQAAAVFILNASLLRGQASGTLEFLLDTQRLGTTALARGAAPAPAPRPAPVDSPAVDLGANVTLGTLLSADCRTDLARYQDSELYAADRDWAQFVVTPTGNVVYRPADLVDENDRVRVVVVGDQRLVSRLVVTRKSAFRTPGTINFVGQGTNLGFNFKGAAPCDSAAFMLGDFAPGQGQVQIAVVNPDGGQTNTGTFDFAVHTLYSGAFSLGAFRTQLRNPTFGVSAVGADTVLTQTEDGTPRLLYMLSYTHFIWGKRDILKSEPWYHHVNPMVGVVLSDIRNNGVAGVSIDLANGLYLQGGAHAGRVTRLDPQSGLKLGDRFTQPASTIPTVREWDVDWFVGVSVDVRAAAELLRMAVTGQKPGS
ncbi:MAG: hypothetical protein ACJ8GN_25115 [Longimicrobiaceae bacterium]